MDEPASGTRTGVAIGTVAAALAAVLYGSAYVSIAIALDGFTPVGVAVWRGVLGAAFLGGLMLFPALAGHRPRGLDMRAWSRLALIGFVGGGVFVLAMNAAVAVSGATITAFVAGLYAVAAAFLAIPVLGERLAGPTVLALLAALAGTVLLSDLPSGGGKAEGIASALVAATSFGLFLVLSRRWSAPHGLSGPLVGLASLAISAAVGLGLAVLTSDPIMSASPTVGPLVAIAWVAIGPGAVASVLVVIAMRRLPAQTASLLLLINPPTAALLAIGLLDERLAPIQIAGAALILGAIGAANGVLPRRMVSRRSSRPGSGPPMGSR